MSEEDAYGPVLPPGFSSPTIEEEEEYGPSLPPGMRPPTQEESEEDDGTYGPALPPSLKNQHDTRKEDSNDEDDGYGPPLPPEMVQKERQGSEEGSPDDIIGPLPPSVNEDVYSRTAAEEFEDRARAMKNKLTGKNTPSAPSRESWMTDLPEYSKAFGLGSRTFRKTNRPENDDRSVWTDTPADRERKEKERQKLAKSSKSSPKKEMSEKDKQISQQVASYNASQRGESLVDMHSKSRKRKLEESGESKERRPFDRDVDLGVNRFDEAQRKNLIKKSAELDTRFSHGKKKVYL